MWRMQSCGPPPSIYENADTGGGVMHLRFGPCVRAPGLHLRRGCGGSSQMEGGVSDLKAQKRISGWRCKFREIHSHVCVDDIYDMCIYV
jgi:hypothetical protein